MTSNPWINALVVAAKELFADGIHDPSAEDLAEHHYGGLIYPASTVDDIIKRMGRVRRTLADDGYQTAPVAEKYYRRGTVNGRPKPVTELAEATLQLASGRGKRCAGLVHFTGDNKSHALVWQAWQKVQATRNGAAFGRNMQDIIDAVDEGKMSEADARTALESGFRTAVEANPVTLNRVMAAELPAEGETG